MTGREWCWDSRAGSAPFTFPLLACTHVPADCVCTWSWLARARALARKYANASCPSRHNGAWLVPDAPNLHGRADDNGLTGWLSECLINRCLRVTEMGRPSSRPTFEVAPH